MLASDHSGSLTHVHTQEQLHDPEGYQYLPIYQVFITIYNCFCPTHNELYINEREIFSSLR